MIKKILALLFLLGMGLMTAYPLGQKVLNETLVQKHYEFMNAMHSGNYELAKQIATEYKIGPAWMFDEQLYQLKSQLYQAYLNKDQTKINELRNKIIEYKNQNNIKGFSQGFKASKRNKNFGKCPFMQQNIQ